MRLSPGTASSAASVGADRDAVKVCSTADGGGAPPLPTPSDVVQRATSAATARRDARSCAETGGAAGDNEAATSGGVDPATAFDWPGAATAVGGGAPVAAASATGADTSCK